MEAGCPAEAGYKYHIPGMYVCLFCADGVRVNQRNDIGTSVSSLLLDGNIEYRRMVKLRDYVLVAAGAPAGSVLTKQKPRGARSHYNL